MPANQYNYYYTQNKYYQAIANEYTQLNEHCANNIGPKIAITTTNLGRSISLCVSPGGVDKTILDVFPLYMTPWQYFWN